MPADPRPEISIVIPSHNRRDRLLGALDALAGQDFPMARAEVVVVADGCRDDTAAAARGWRGPFPVTVVELPGVGPAVARNTGAETARAPLLLFLDDDVEPLPGWARAHVDAHKTNPDAVAIGAYPPVPSASGGEFRALARGWWRARFDELAREGHRFTFRDMLTGNFSLSAELWARLGGLDPAFAQAHEDWELGVRLIEAGVPMVFARGATAWHHEYETSDLAASLRRARAEGRADVRLGRRHPQLKPALPIVRFWREIGGSRAFAARQIYRFGPVGEPVARASGALARLLSRWRAGPLFRAAYGVANPAAYLRGAAEELGSLDAWRAFADDIPYRRVRSLSIDLSSGIAAAEARIGEVRPDDVRLFHMGRDIGRMPYAPAAERWDARHLRPWIARHGIAVMLANEAWDGAEDGSVEPPGGAARYWAGSRGYFAAQGENASQWQKAGL